MSGVEQPSVSPTDERAVYWCDACGVPLLGPICGRCSSPGRRVAADLRPMFKTQLEILSERTRAKWLCRLPVDQLWMQRRTIYYAGRRLLRLTADANVKIAKLYRDPSRLPDPPSAGRHGRTSMLRSANACYLRALEREALDFIRETASSFPGRTRVVSFSGGKDSAVVSHLVRRALRTQRIVHIFGDTTIEYPDTYDYVRSFRRSNRHVPFVVAKCHHDWYDMCRALQPPSAILRWCCTVFKASPLAAAMREVGGEGVLNFEGVRKRESRGRADAQRIYRSKKIACQMTAEPILEWSEFAVWVYVLTRSLPLNRAYEKGFPRVGCLHCPYSAPSTEGLIRSTCLAQRDARYGVEANRWRDFLFAYAERIGKEQPREYVNSGGWKARAGVSTGTVGGAVLTRHPGPCGGEVENRYVLTKPVDESFYEFMKPLGVLRPFSDPGLGIFDVCSRTAGNGSDGVPLFRLQAIKGWPYVSTVIHVVKGKHLLRQRIEKQMRKFQACRLCGGCAGVCPSGAISVDGRLSVNDERCTGCLRCSNREFLGRGCVALDSTQQHARYRAQ